MRKAWVVVLAVIFIAGAAIVARRGGRLRTNSSAQGGNSQSDSQRTASDSKTTVAVSSAGSSAAIEISKHGPGMRRQPPESLKLPVPRTFDLKHIDPRSSQRGKPENNSRTRSQFGLVGQGDAESLLDSVVQKWDVARSRSLLCRFISG